MDATFLHPGSQRVGKGRESVRVYPETAACPFQLRTIEQHLRDIEIVKGTLKPLLGILGPTPFANLPGFNFIKAFIPEYMHPCCQGCFKQMIQLFTDSKHTKKSWSIRGKLAEAKSRLSNTRPCYGITREMGALDDLSNWKASMFKNFALFFYTILKDLLPAEYFQNFANLSYGMLILLQEKISIRDVKNVWLLFANFVKEMERLYGIEHIGINIHFLTHLSQSVLDWGCLWATSTFIPEWFNGELGTYFNGTQSVID